MHPGELQILRITEHTLIKKIAVTSVQVRKTALNISAWFYKGRFTRYDLSARQYRVALQRFSESGRFSLHELVR